MAALYMGILGEKVIMNAGIWCVVFGFVTLKCRAMYTIKYVRAEPREHCGGSHQPIANPGDRLVFLSAPSPGLSLLFFTLIIEEKPLSHTGLSQNAHFTV